MSAARGELNGVKLGAGGGVRLRNPETLQLAAGVLVLDPRAQALPQMR